jgi:hypothetical protein
MDDADLSQDVSLVLKLDVVMVVLVAIVFLLSVKNPLLPSLARVYFGRV